MTQQQALNLTPARLETNRPAPNFTLPALGGGTITRSVYRGRRHLALAFLPAADPRTRDELVALRAQYGAVTAAGSELVVVLGPPTAGADALRAALDLPFPVLLDEDRVAAGRFLPDAAVAGLFILDRYAMLRAQWALADLPLPPGSEILSWLEAIDNQCVL